MTTTNQNREKATARAEAPHQSVHPAVWVEKHLARKYRRSLVATIARASDVFGGTIIGWSPR